jgi:hypothetical protein
MMTSDSMLRTRLRLFVLVAAVAAAATGVLQTASASSPSLAMQACVGRSSIAGSTWTFTAGSPSLISGQVSTSVCSLGTTADDGIPPVIGKPSAPPPPPIASGDKNPVDNVLWAGSVADGALCQIYTNDLIPCGPFLAPESLVASTIDLSGSGTFSCAGVGNGSLASPSLSDEIAAGNIQNIVSTDTGYPGIDNSARIVWSATFKAGIGLLHGTLFGADDPAATPEAVSGVVVVHCNASGRRLLTASLLHMASMPLT